MADQPPFDPHKTRLFHSPGPLPHPRKQPPPLPAAKPDWSKTRVVPIELLLPGLAKRRPASATQRLPRRPAPLISRSRVYAWAVCIALWVSVAAASGMPSPAPEPPAVTIETAVPKPVAHVSASAGPRAARANPPAPPPSAAAGTQPRISPRTAVEALAAGDTLAASNAYAALAQQNPNNLAYARAARILKQRLQVQPRRSGDTP